MSPLQRLANAREAAYCLLNALDTRQPATAEQSEQITLDHGTHDDAAEAFEVARKILDENAACVCTQVRRELRQ